MNRVYAVVFAGPPARQKQLNPALLKSNDFSTKKSAFEIARSLPNQQRPKPIESLIQVRKP